MRWRRWCWRLLPLLLPLLGSLVMVGDNYNWLKHVGFRGVEDAMNRLSRLDGIKITPGARLSCAELDTTHPGFDEIANLLKGRFPEIRNEHLVRIGMVGNTTKFCGIEYEALVYVTIGGYRNREKALAWKSELQGWVKDYERGWFTSVGLLLLLVGFPAQLAMELRLARRQKHRGRRHPYCWKLVVRRRWKRTLRSAKRS